MTMETSTNISNESKVSKCEFIISYSFKNKSFALQALNTSGEAITYANERLSVPKNKALAIFGDAKIQMILCEWWWNSSSPQVPEEWTTLRNAKLTNKALDTLGKQLGLHECVILNPGTTEVSVIMMATTFEAVFGAVWMDGGEEECKRVMRGLGFDQHVYL